MTFEYGQNKKKKLELLKLALALSKMTMCVVLHIQLCQGNGETSFRSKIFNFAWIL